MARRRSRSASEPRALTAAATRIRLDDRKMAKRQGARRQQWQDDAWEYFDLFGFVKQALWLEANQASKARLFAAVANPDDPDGEPIPVDHETSPVPPDVAAQCIAELARLKGPLGGLPEILRELDLNLEVPGEGYLIGIGARPEQVDTYGKVTAPAVDESWQVRSTSEVHVQEDGAYRVRDDPGMSLTQGYKLDPEYDTAIRFWLPHPRYSNLPDSPMHGELEDFETLLILSRQRRAEGKSRLPGGLLLIDSNVTATSPVKAPTDDGSSQSTTGDTVLDAIADALADAIEDESSAAGMAPVTVRVSVPPGSDVSKMVAKVDMSRSSEGWLDSRITLLVESVARGLNLPVEKVMGHQQTTYANAGQVDEDDFFDHTEPRVVLIVDLLSSAFLRPQLLAPDDRGAPAPPQFVEWAPQIFVWYDASAILGTPDRGASADSGHDRMAISDSAWRAAKGYSEDDAPDPIEVLVRTAIEHGKIGGDFTKALLDLLGVTVDVTPGESGDISGAPPAGVARYRALAELLVERAGLPQLPAQVAALHVLDEPIPVRSTPTHSTPAVEPLSLSTLSRTAERNPGRRLVDLDRDLRTRLLILCSTAMTRALEKAGNRAKQKLPEARALVRNVDSRFVCATLGPSIIAAGGVDDADLLEGAFDEIESAFMRWGASAQREALDLAAELGTGLSTAQRDAFGLRQADDLTEAWQWLKEQLTTQAHARMFAPEVAATLGEFDPDLAVAPGMIRQAITRAGGTIGVETKGEGDAWVSMRTNGGPAGGIGTGEVVRDALGASGNSVEAYQWVYGPAARKHPFEPHSDLDGTVFRNFDDDVLANTEGFPEYDYYFPGDHAGCVCDFEPIIVDSSELSGGTSADTTDATVPDVQSSEPASISSLDDLRAWGDERGITIDDALSQIESSTLQDVAQVYDDMAERYPQIDGMVDSIEWAPANIGEGARIDPERYSIGKATTKSSVVVERSQVFIDNPKIVATNDREVWLHEMGHVVHNSTPWMRQIAGDGMQYTPEGRSMIRTAMQEAGYANARKTIARDLITSDVSIYASTGGDREFFAEVFTLFNREGGISSLPIEAQNRLLSFRTALNALAGETVL